MHVRRMRCSRYKLIWERSWPGKRGNSLIMRTAEEQIDLIAGPALSRRLDWRPPGVPFRLNYLQSCVHSTHLTERAPCPSALCDGLTLWRPEGFWPSPDSPGPPWEMIARRYVTRNSQQHIAGNLQLQSTLVHPQGSTFKPTDFRDTSRKLCLSNTCGLNYVLEMPNFLLNKY